MTAEGTCAPELNCSWYDTFKEVGVPNIDYTISIKNLTNEPRHLRVYIFNTQNLMFGDEEYDMILAPHDDRVPGTGEGSTGGLIGDPTKPSHFEFKVANLDDPDAVQTRVGPDNSESAGIEPAGANTENLSVSTDAEKQDTTSVTEASLIGAWAFSGSIPTGEASGLYYYQFNADHTFVYGDADLGGLSDRTETRGTYIVNNSDIILTATYFHYFMSSTSPARGNQNLSSALGGDGIIGSPSTINWKISGNVLTLTSQAYYYPVSGRGSGTYLNATTSPDFSVDGQYFK